MRDVKIKLFIMFICCLGLMACGKGTEDPEALSTTTIDNGEYVYMPECWELEPLEGLEGGRYLVSSIRPAEEYLYYAVRTYGEKSNAYIVYRSYTDFTKINLIPIEILKPKGNPYVDMFIEDGEGNNYVVWSDYIEAEGKSYSYLSKITFDQLLGTYIPGYKVSLEQFFGYNGSG